MKEPRLRFTTREKLVILEEIHILGLESTLQKFHVTIAALIRWQKKFKGSKAGNLIHPIERVIEKEKALKSKLEKRLMGEKEDAFLRLVASLIVQTVLKNDTPDR